MKDRHDSLRVGIPNNILSNENIALKVFSGSGGLTYLFFLYKIDLREFFVKMKNGRPDSFSKEEIYFASSVN